MLTPPPLPQFNAQKSENIQRRHDLQAKKESEGLTPEEEQELTKLHDLLKAYDRDNAQLSENRAEHRALWDKFFTNDATPTEFDRLCELNLKYRVEWTNLVFPNSLNAEVKVSALTFFVHNVYPFFNVPTSIRSSSDAFLLK